MNKDIPLIQITTDATTEKNEKQERKVSMSKRNSKIVMESELETMMARRASFVSKVESNNLSDDMERYECSI